jgi:predicted TIM-barrel fold metal-dependent hydrolase
VVLPTFTAEWPVFHKRFEPIWSLLEDLDMPLNSHATFSATVQQTRYSGVPHPAVETPLHVHELMFRCHELLPHLIFGGVLERHPRLRVAFSEQGSAWVPAALESMDSSFRASFMRRDVRDIVPKQPSEYFREQCWLGSSIFSRAEIQAREQIGIDAICIGMDYPHQEGTFHAGTVRYLRATLGAAGVPPAEARRMLGENAIERWRLDGAALRRVADRIGPDLDLVLTPPAGAAIERGDVHKALNTSM